MIADLDKLRQEYAEELLDLQHVDPNPLKQLANWLSDALNAGLPEPNAMTLATTDANGNPSARVVLLKGLDHGLDFYTNYLSRKGREMAENPRVAVVFLWLELQRQVRVEGIIEKLPELVSAQYFASRPLGSQIGAMASPQSQPVAERQELENTFSQLMKEYGSGKPVPKPEHWGGYKIIPHTFEFWQGRRSRLHDRLLFTLNQQQEWIISRLAP